MPPPSTSRTVSSALSQKIHHSSTSKKNPSLRPLSVSQALNISSSSLSQTVGESYDRKRVVSSSAQISPSKRKQIEDVLDTSTAISRLLESSSSSQELNASTDIMVEISSSLPRVPISSPPFLFLKSTVSCDFPFICCKLIWIQEQKRALEYFEDLIDDSKSFDQKSNFRFISKRILQGQLQVLSSISRHFLFVTDIVIIRRYKKIPSFGALQISSMTPTSMNGKSQSSGNFLCSSFSIIHSPIFISQSCEESCV